MSDEEPVENSRTATSSMSWWKRLALALVLAVISSAYPLLMASSHKVTNIIPEKVPNQVWDDRKIGAAIELLEREDFYGWAAASPSWHPKSRLIAMPAYQQGISDTLSEFARLRAGTGDKQDSDLKHATSLLKQLNGQDTADKMHATIEALRRYHGRKARNLLDERNAEDVLKDDLALFARLLDKIIAEQTKIAAEPTRGVFNREIVQAYYHAKGELHAIGILIRATNPNSYEVMGIKSALNRTVLALERASRAAPLTVSNPQPGKFSFGGNDIMQQAFLTLRAQQELSHLQNLLADSPNS